MDEVLLEVKNLSVVLGKEKIIDNLSFQATEGETITILGPNGAGKTILVKTLLGLLPYEGEIIWQKKLKLGYLPQELNRMKSKNIPLTVLDFFKLKKDKPNEEEISKFLEKVGLKKDSLSKNIGNLSGGQFQRMLVAWTLISNPKIIFFDEPILGVDIGGGETIHSLISDLQKEKDTTIFLVTHDLNIVFKHSNNVLCLGNQRKHYFGPPKKILSPDMLEKVFGMEIKFHNHD